MSHIVHRVVFPLVALLMLIFSTLANAQTSGYQCGIDSRQVSAFGYGVNRYEAAVNACVAWAPQANATYDYATEFNCFANLNDDGGQVAPNVVCQSTGVCPLGNGQYADPNPDGSCPSPCPEASGGALPFDTPDCGCSDPDYSAVNLTGGPIDVVGCIYEPECPAEDSTAATGCTGPNGVDYDHSLCLPIKNPDQPTYWCEATYSDGTINYKGGRGTLGCATSQLQNTSEYGCDQPEEEGDETNNDSVDTATEGTPDNPTVIIRDDGGTPNDPSDDKTYTRERSSSTTTNSDGTTTTTETETTTETDSNGDTTTTTTETRRHSDGTTTTTTTRVNADGTTTRSVSGTGGTQTCTGPDCDDIENDGQGTTAGKCGTPPRCTGKPIECAMLAQEYNLQCGVEIADHLDCKVPVTCSGNPMDCAIIEQQKQAYCTLVLTEGFEESESLQTFKQGIDDGSDYFGSSGENQINVADKLSLDNSGLGWASSCPANNSFSIYGQTVEISFQPLCDWLIFLNPLLLLIGYIHAGFIFMRGVTGG